MAHYLATEARGRWPPRARGLLKCAQERYEQGQKAVGVLQRSLVGAVKQSMPWRAHGAPDGD
eukprot:1380877-Alexandrium_andersonii.AAC.1